MIASNPFINAGPSLLRLFSSGWFEFWNYKENDNSNYYKPNKRISQQFKFRNWKCYDIYCPPRCSVNSYLLSQHSCHFKHGHRLGSFAAIIFPCTLMHIIGFLIHLLFVPHLLSFHTVLINLHFY